MADGGPAGWLDGAAKLAGVKQGSGALGKLCTMGSIALAAMALGLCAMAFTDGWVAAGILVGVLAIAGMFLMFAWVALGYAERDPLGAGLDSEHLSKVRIKELEITQKNGEPSVPTVNVTPESIQTPPPQVGQPVLTELVQEPAQ